ncbi:MAG TPA: RNA polymerase sigma-70 factor [Prolixibacteraceae bacterium]|nr:RNA polymerase sigma-70 factor [Prolixibacteraceae bacterium]
MAERPVYCDNELIKKLKKGDIDAFNQIFYAYSSKLYHFAYGYLKSKEDAEEMVQEIFSGIWDKRADIKEEFQFRSYLFSIAFNYIKKHFRSKALVVKYIEFANPHDLETEQTQEDVNYSSLKLMVDQLVDKMPEKRKAVFFKSRFEGKNSKEIAVEMNISQSTVENHLNQALRFLRQHLKDENLAGLLFFWLFIQ